MLGLIPLYAGEVRALLREFVGLKEKRLGGGLCGCVWFDQSPDLLAWPLGTGSMTSLL